MAPSRIAAMTRVASRLPSGSLRVAYINLMMREAAGFGGLQQYAAEQFLSGLLKKSPSKVQKMVKEHEVLKKTILKNKKRNRSSVPVPGMVQKTDLTKRQKTPGGMEIQKALEEIGFEGGLHEITHGRLWDYIARIASSTMGGSFGDTVPGTAGVSGEDIAQVLGFGGIPWPGQIWDGSKKAYVDRTNAVMSKEGNKNIFVLAGKAAGKGKIKNGMRSLKSWLKTAVFNLTSNFIRSVDAGIHAKFEYDQDGQMIVDSLGYEPAPLAEYLTQARHLQRINKAMLRELASAPGQLVVWKLLMDAISKGKQLLKTNRNSNEVTVKAGELRKHALEKLKDDYGDIDLINPSTEKPYKDSVPSPQALQRNFDKILPKMRAAMEHALGTPASGDAAELDRDADIRGVYEQSIRRRAGKTITASERSAMIRLASVLPVGSPERRALLAGCEKLPEGPMRDNCEKKKEEGASDKKAGKGTLPDALKKHQFTSDDNPNPKGNDKDGDGKSGEKKPFESKKKSARVKSKRESMGMMNDLREKHGDRTKAYYQAVIDEVKAGVIAPSAVVGGGYKNGKKVAIEWLEGQMKGKKAALVRLAAALPVGSDERKTILRMASAH